MPKAISVEQFKTEAVKPLYAVAGATELAFGVARGYASEAQKAYQQGFGAVQTRVTSLPRIDYRDPRALSGQAQQQVLARFEELNKQARQAQAAFEARVAELQKDAVAYPARVQAQVNDALEDLTETYAELAERGEKFVAAIRKDGVRAVTTVKKAPANSTVARRERAKQASTGGSTGGSTGASTGASTAKKSTAKKSTSSTAKKSAAKKSTSSTARKPATRKSTAKKSTAKKSTSAQA